MLRNEPAQSQGLRGRNKADKLARIEKAGRALFARRGFDDTTTRAIAEKKLLLVNFTGYTCVNCRLNEEKVFPAAAVRALLDEHFVEARLHTDGDRGEELSAFQEKLTHSIATPLYLVIDPKTERRIGGQVGGVQRVEGFREFLASAVEQSELKVGQLGTR